MMAVHQCSIMAHPAVQCLPWRAPRAAAVAWHCFRMAKLGERLEGQVGSADVRVRTWRKPGAACAGMAVVDTRWQFALAKLSGGGAV